MLIMGWITTVLGGILAGFGLVGRDDYDYRVRKLFHGNQLFAADWCFYIGIALLAIGVLLLIIGYISYFSAKKQTEEDLNTMGLGNVQNKAASLSMPESEALLKCPNCRQPVAAGNAFCTYCGAKIDVKKQAVEKKCTTCGAMSPLESAFCSKCGHPFETQENTGGKR